MRTDAPYDEVTATAIFDRLPRVQQGASFRLSDRDLVIHAPGFEDRTMAITDMVVAAHGARGILLDYHPANSANRLGDVRTALQSKGVSISPDDVVMYDRFAPSDFEARLARQIAASGARRVLIDISTMSKLAILLVLEVCRRANLHIVLLYAEAERYRPTQDEFSNARIANEIHQPSLQVFTGVHGVVRVDSLASVAMQGQPTAAIVFMSFNDILTQVLLNTVFPGRLFLINSRPPVHSWREAATAWIHAQVRAEWEEDNPLSPDSHSMPARVTSTLDYRESVQLLLELYWGLSANHRVLLAPSGSKMQAVACHIIKSLHPDIHIEYPSPEGFVPEYSSGVAALWSVDLGDWPITLASIAEAERHKYLEIAPC
ncbi:MAG TPA: hypothetical protein VF618_27870 [Thermoanaerobaculia bacterium]